LRRCLRPAGRNLHTYQATPSPNGRSAHHSYAARTSAAPRVADVRRGWLFGTPRLGAGFSLGPFAFRAFGTAAPARRCRPTHHQSRRIMTKKHDQRRPPRAAEPVQVYLERPDAERLGRLASQLSASKSDVLRQGLEALERQLTDRATHPALRIIGIAGPLAPPKVGYDVARQHDRFLAESEVSSWKGLRSPARRGR
jgi:Arc/MetJ-type ribon-helix-helix transcriptional regulator